MAWSWDGDYSTLLVSAHVTTAVSVSLSISCQRKCLMLMTGLGQEPIGLLVRRARLQLNSTKTKWVILIARKDSELGLS